MLLFFNLTTLSVLTRFFVDDASQTEDAAPPVNEEPDKVCVPPAVVKRETIWLFCSIKFKRTYKVIEILVQIIHRERFFNDCSVRFFKDKVSVFTEAPKTLCWTIVLCRQQHFLCCQTEVITSDSFALCHYQPSVVWMKSNVKSSGRPLTT